VSRLLDDDVSPVIRSDFSNQPAWEALRARIAAPGEDGILASVSFIEDRAYEGITPDQVHALFENDDAHAIAIVADTTTMNDAESPLLVIDLLKTATEIRVATRDLWALENCVSCEIAIFDDYALVEEGGMWRFSENKALTLGGNQAREAALSGEPSGQIRATSFDGLLPLALHPLVVRTDHSNGAAWNAIRHVIEAPNELGFRAYVDYLDDSTLHGATSDRIRGMVPPGYSQPIVIIADRKSMIDEGMPLLVFGLTKRVKEL
jgi:hypothetical protein